MDIYSVIYSLKNKHDNKDFNPNQTFYTAYIDATGQDDASNKIRAEFPMFNCDIRSSSKSYTMTQEEYLNS